MKKAGRSDGFDLTPSNLAAAAATVVFVAVIGWVAFAGHQQASAARETSKPSHHMASLSQIQAFMKKAQDAQDAQDDQSP